MSPNKDETAVHCCHCPGDVAVRMSVWCSVCPPHALLLFATTKIRKKQKQQLKTKLSTRTLSISFGLVKRVPHALLLFATIKRRNKNTAIYQNYLFIYLFIYLRM